MALISIVIPCYNEAAVLPLFYDELTKVSDGLSEKYDLSFEFIFVNDGSKDGTLDVLQSLYENDAKKRIHYISFSRNFGKEAAIYAGIETAKGDLVAVMDADMQDPPEMLEAMYLGIVEEGYDCVGSRRVTRKGEPHIRSFFARMFYRIINRISHTQIVDGARDFRMMTRKMVDAILELKEVNRFSKGLFSWVGFSTKWLAYENVERVAGETKWSFFKLFLYSIDGIVAFSTAPLAVASLLGLLFCVIAFAAAVFIIIRQLVFGNAAYGWSSMVCILLGVSGIQLFCIGILGQYLSKTYLETKKRPIYIVKEQSNEDKNP